MYPATFFCMTGNGKARNVQRAPDVSDCLKIVGQADMLW